MNAHATESQREEVVTGRRSRSDRVNRFRCELCGVGLSQEKATASRWLPLPTAHAILIESTDLLPPDVKARLLAGTALEFLNRSAGTFDK